MFQTVKLNQQYFMQNVCIGQISLNYTIKNGFHNELERNCCWNGRLGHFINGQLLSLFLLLKDILQPDTEHNNMRHQYLHTFRIRIQSKKKKFEWKITSWHIMEWLLEVNIHLAVASRELKANKQSNILVLSVNYN